MRPAMRESRPHETCNGAKAGSVSNGAKSRPYERWRKGRVKKFNTNIMKSKKNKAYALARAFSSSGSHLIYCARIEELKDRTTRI
jgi:hypothetical protein